VEGTPATRKDLPAATCGRRRAFSVTELNSLVVTKMTASLLFFRHHQGGAASRPAGSFPIRLVALDHLESIGGRRVVGK